MRSSIAGPLGLLAGMAVSSNCHAHGFAGSGLLHPLTGWDHALAMLAVGAWSAQLGGRAIYVVPACFVLLMLLGALLGLGGWHLLGSVEALVALSVLLLGLAIGANRRLALLPAGAAVALFGCCHGFAHGAEIPQAVNQATYIGGILVTTAGLHLVGAVGAVLLTEQQSGQKTLQLLGFLTALAGGWLLNLSLH
jgi:urease accessory protein